MGICVEFKDGMQGEVPSVVLDRLIELNLIARFKREAGWAALGVDPVRKRSPMVSFPERRTTMQALNAAGYILPRQNDR